MTNEQKSRKTGIGAPIPKEICDDINCPFHGTLKVRGRTFVGHVTSAKRHKTAQVEWERRHPLKKYERHERRRTRLHAHNPPCLNAKEGDMVKIVECRPLSKTKAFVIIEKLGTFVKILGIDETKEKKIKKENKEIDTKKKSSKKEETQE